VNLFLFEEGTLIKITAKGLINVPFFIFHNGFNKSSHPVSYAVAKM